MYTERQNTIFALTSIETIIATVATALRVYSRLTVEASFGWDDATILLSLTLMIGALGLLYVSVQYGLGVHQAALHTARAQFALELQWAMQPLQVAANTIARLSISILLIRLFNRKKWLTRTLIGMAVLNIVVGVVGVTLIFTQCQPVQAVWDPSIKDPRCIPHDVQERVAITKASISAACDLVTAAWPIAIITTLQMHIRKKIFLAVMFAMTLIAFVSCVVEATTISSNAIREDQTYISSALAIWLHTNTAIIIIAANLPALVPLYRRWNGHGGSSSNSRWGSHSHSKGKLSGTRKTDPMDQYPQAFNKGSTALLTDANAHKRSGSEEFMLEPTENLQRPDAIHVRQDFNVNVDSHE